MPVDNNLDHLYPDFRVKVSAVVNEMTRWCSVHLPGYRSVMFEGYRSQTRQNELYAQGRTTPGQIVTKIKVSNHTSCLAADIIALNPQGVPTWDLPQEFWDYLRHTAHVYGLQETQDYSGFVDEDHVQWDQSDRNMYNKAAAWRDSQPWK